MSVIDVVPLHETTRTRYLNYALSVITSRALPDVRDGLKPVQRRILYAMYTNLRLTPDARYKKSASVVGEVMGKYHPHGDTAIYDAMVRMAQDFSLRYPLVEGHGNFGSIDGDSPAAMRYTEVRLQPLALELLQEIRQRTVAFRANYDGSLFEPVVLPARFPNLLANGASGIAVGMATNIPPHNLRELIDALIALSKHPTLSTARLMEYIKGPDFPTGGRILNTPEELQAIYESGEGSLSLRGEYRVEKLGGGKTGIIIYSIPYGLSKASLIEKIAEHIQAGKIPQLVDIRDESTDEMRIVLELRRGAHPEAAMAYLFKHTPLQTRFHVNLTCLVPTEHPEIGAPRKVSLKEALQYFLDFRYEVVVQRLRHELEQLLKRIHILKGFAIIFQALDEAIKIIRGSKNRADAAQRLMHRFRLDEVQTDAILETKLYRLSRLEIDDILQELEKKEARAAEIQALLDDEQGLWKLIRKELREIKKTYADPRRTLIAGPDTRHTYDEEHYIPDEDVYVIVTRDGWIKRQRSYTDISAIRVREGDEVGWVIAGSTRASVAFFTNFGKVYTLRIEQLPSTSGYGDPVQKYFDFADRERVVGVAVFDRRIHPEPLPEPETEPALFETNGKDTTKSAPSWPYVVAISRKGLCLRLPGELFLEPSTKLGRTFARPPKDDEILGVDLARGNEHVCLASEQGRVLIFPVQEIPLFKGAGKGVIGIRLDKDDQLLGFVLSSSAREGLEIETNRGRREIVRTTKFPVSRRGNRGKRILQRGTLKAIKPTPVEIHLP